jgi:hypothetical protein
MLRKVANLLRELGQRTMLAGGNPYRLGQKHNDLGVSKIAFRHVWAARRLVDLGFGDFKS